MTFEMLEQIVHQGEGYNLEFKQSIPSKTSDLAKEFCAFANAKGGTILIGVDDKGGIVGVTIDNAIRSEVQHVMGLLDPRLDVDISELRLNNKTVLCLECKDGPQKPYAVSGAIYIRNGPNSEKITSIEQMKKFFQQSGSIFFDTMGCTEFKYSEHFDSVVFKLFLQKSNITDTIGEKEVLYNLRLAATGDVFTYAAVMMFAKDVQHFLDYAIIRCVVFKGTDKRYILDDKEMGGNIVRQFEETLKYIISKLNLRYDIEGQFDGRRKEVLEIPEAVFREALINSLCHRSYYEKGAVTMVEIYDNRVEISNPGGLISVISEGEFGRKSFSRNPLLFGMMQRIGLVEKVGSGITRMRETMKEANLPDPVFKIGGFFTVILYRPFDFQGWITSIKDKLSEKQYFILQRLNNFPDSTIRTMAEVLSTTTRTIERNITVLKKIGLLERVGSDREGYYRINRISL